MKININLIFQKKKKKLNPRIGSSYYIMLLDYYLWLLLAIRIWIPKEQELQDLRLFSIFLQIIG